MSLTDVSLFTHSSVPDTGKQTYIYQTTMELVKNTSSKYGFTVRKRNHMVVQRKSINHDYTHKDTHTSSKYEKEDNDKQKYKKKNRHIF